MIARSRARSTTRPHFLPRVASADEWAAVDAWALTQTLSRRTGRRHVRVVTRDAYGHFENRYPHTHATRDDVPDAPWALPLTDTAGGFWFIPFDLDATDGNPIADSRRLTRWLGELGIAFTVCQSGPTGGRHVWVAMSEPAAPELVYRLARRARLLLPSLDIKPLSNPAAGAVRPPLSPHRSGEISVPLTPLDPLLRATTTTQQLAALDIWLEEEGAELPPPPRTTRPRGVLEDESGHPYLTGDRRELSPRIRTMLNHPPAEDASATMAQVFLAAANARWRHGDVLTLAHSAPALEHARSKRSLDQRVPRTKAGLSHTVDSAWRMAVAYAAAHPADRIGDDPTFPIREAHVVHALTRAQEHADATPGLWGADRASRSVRAVRGSAAHRAVFDALCLYMGQAVQLDVEADIRRLALETGWGRTTVQTALTVLQDMGWIVRAAEAENEHGARYRLSDQFSTEGSDPNWAQGRKPATRLELLRSLTLRLTTLNNDVFAAPRSLGRAAGVVLLQMRPSARWSLGDLATRIGISAGALRRHLHRLSFFGLVRRSKGLWTSRAHGDLDRLAQELQVAGYLQARRKRYELERIVWTKWLNEVRWMKQDHVTKRRVRPHPTAAQFGGSPVHDRSRYPRGPDSRADHKTARRLEAARMNLSELIMVLEEGLGL